VCMHVSLLASSWQCREACTAVTVDMTKLGLLASCAFYVVVVGKHCGF